MTAPVRVPVPADLSDRIGDPDALVRLESVAKTYTARRGAGAVTALEDIDLSVSRGRVLGVIGRSGAGKSTLIRLVNGLERPSRGRVIVDRAEISALSESALRAERRGIGMIFQHFNLLSARTAAGNVALPLEVAGYDKAAIRRRVAELLDLVGLAPQADRYPAELSGGQKQRVGIARALATNPKVLLSDEATSALDPETTRSILDLLGRINRELGLTILLITHEMAVIRAIAHEVAVLDGGRIAESGDVFEVFTRPRAAITRTFLDEETGRTLPPALAARLTPGLTAGEGEGKGEGKQAVLRITFRGPHATDPVLAQLTSELGIPAGILSGTVDEIAGRPFGTLVVGIAADPGTVERARTFLAARGLDVEMLGTLDLAGWQRTAAPGSTDARHVA
ncbi:methionine ABC transporter ATP-binding protein [Methylobacterium sp. 17Sr1-1]|uniref:methionine ABC transporter ATP-binding protein n=1 Tax=Methylobacterium sp. 17Sr1-1 TaxID=2202826 RepID=UPI000D6F71F8|nr:methionine ABC transporter ATP-binding protein [Methylobacterium sp. 17Sr1-1]AWN52122.1 methionine ABC transporter ATP-binding protein [Methylobacterium sp. 17Sr1-1]